MNRLFAVKPLLVITAALAIALVLACGGRGETMSPGSLLRLLPQNADSFTFADLEQLRDERLDNLEQQLASFIGEGRLDDWEIDLDDASSLLSDSNNGDALTILRGRFVTEDVEDALDDDGLRDSVHRDVTVWSERSGGVALAFVGEDVIVIGEEERVEDSIDVFIGRSAVDGAGRRGRGDPGCAGGCSGVQRRRGLQLSRLPQARERGARRGRGPGCGVRIPIPER